MKIIWNNWSRKEKILFGGLIAVIGVSLILTGLKLAGSITWTWFQVAAPIYFYYVALVLILIVAPVWVFFG